MVAAVGSMVAFSLPTFITGLELYHGLTPWQTVWALVIGSALVFAIGCPEFYRQPDALKAVSPRHFGFDLDYIPLGQLPY
jgi:DUF917 family protein